ncbi:MAG: hypothetical protein F7C36_00880 [Desulfurococcales archaeon]|nr:hypothetical protein [Desulfurococcales archaeon]
MPRRLYRVNSAPDFSGFEEPILLAGTTPLSLKNIIAIGVGLAIIGMGLLWKTPVLVREPFPLSLGLLLGLAGGLSIIMWSTMIRPDQSSLPILKLIVTRPTQPKERKRRIEPITIRADEETGIARIELEGYAYDPASGKPLDRVDVVIDGKVHGVDTVNGKYYLEVELSRGIHRIVVRLSKSQIILREFDLRII